MDRRWVPEAAGFMQFYRSRVANSLRERPDRENADVAAIFLIKLPFKNITANFENRGRAKYLGHRPSSYLNVKIENT